MNLTKSLNCFKTYDIRGKLGEEINAEIAYRIGRATAQRLSAKNVVLGFDARETSPELSKMVAKGVRDAGANIIDLGLSGTEEMYFSVSEFNADAGIEVTASHNPIDYNGMKIVKQQSQPLTAQEFSDIKTLAESNEFAVSNKLGAVCNKKKEARSAYIKKVLSFVDLDSLKPLKIVINSGNGVAGPVVDALDKAIKEKGVKTDFVRVHHNPDSLFPNGIPNPLIKENRSSTVDVINTEEADFGVAFDGDFDRCFFFDHLGNFVPGEYVVGFLAEVFLVKEKGATIVHDTRVTWNTQNVVQKLDGNAVVSKTGHAFLKSAMRKARAVYGGEMSAHHYFRDFNYCDSGIIPMLLIWELLSKEKILLADLMSERKRYFPSSGEINFKVSDVSACIEKVKKFYLLIAKSLNEIDGLSMSFDGWRFNLRASNTEPLVRLNVETTGNQLLLKKKVRELTGLITAE